MALRTLFTLVITLVVTVLGALPALAGGSWLETRNDDLEPGETATFAGFVSTGQLGWIEDGPFFAYLRVDPSAVAGDAAETTAWPFIHESDVPLGPLEIDDRSHGSQRDLRVSITFQVPVDLPTGSYDIVYCNDPCTNGLGDLIGGTLQIGTGESAALRTEDPLITKEALTRAAQLQELIAREAATINPRAQVILASQMEEILRLNPQAAFVTRPDDDPFSNWLLASVAVGVTAALVGGVVAVRRRRNWAR